MNWEKLLTDCGVPNGTATLWGEAFRANVTPDTFSAGYSELDDFLAQILHESGMLTRLVENLNYTNASRIRAVWPSRFKTDQDAAPFVRNAQLLANKVYGGRNGNTGSDDGWKYRGRGLIMVTFKGNYAALSKVVGVDLLSDPDKLSLPLMALKATIAWWEGNVPDSVMGDVVKVTKKVNGGTIGLEHRKELLAKVQKALKAQGVEV